MSDYLIFGPVISLIFGLLIGSFINCLAWRLFKEETIFGRSYCPKCLTKIKWYDNFPLISFILLKGKCRSCSKKISWQYPLVELATGLLFYAIFLTFNFDTFLLIKNFIFVSILILVFIFDLRWYLVPVSILRWGGLILIILGFFSTSLTFGSYLFALLISILITSAFFGVQYLITKGRGLGEGDIWLGAFLGAAFYNLAHLGVAILSAYFIGSIAGLFLIVIGYKKWSSKLPLGVFLVLGALISLFWGSQILTWYFELFSL